MWEGSYGKEPFDLRLTVLRLIRNLDKIIVLTVVGTLLFGGIYYVKNVLLRPEPKYSVTSTYKVQYVVEPTKSGDYYINSATWNTLVHTQEFLEAVQSYMQEDTAEEGNASDSADFGKMTTEEISEAISATLPADFHIPTTTVVTDDPAKTVLIAGAVEQAMMKELVEMMSKEVTTVSVMDPGAQAKEVPLDARPARAFVLSGVLSFFFIIVFFLLKETGDDSIWLPATLRRRYGLAVLGTICSPELGENIKYLFADKKKIAVCCVDHKGNPAEVAAKLREAAADNKDVEWIPMPAPLLCPESFEALRKLDGILLAVSAGEHMGKPLEYVLEMLGQQDCRITAAMLWEADEALIRAYYCLPGACAAQADEA